MRHIQLRNLDDLVLGSAILGSGGGGRSEASVRC